uniref:Blue wavelength sensitive opsin (B) isoform B n=1 Tax=Biston betularia TaxID=82595 RepID=A0A4Y5FMX2_BISBE|nr:blue wavelength sensitive opsin (B) isoform B [Biston betularia]
MAFNFTDGIGPMAYPLKMVSKEVLDHMLGWNIPEEHQDLVHEHWRNFPAVSKYWHYCLALIYTMLMVTSLTGNGIVIWIFSTSKSLRSASNMFVINLAVFDLMMMLEMPLLILNSFYQRLVGYQLGCDVYAILGSLSGIGGAITNAVIAFDRYKTISCPLDGRINRVQAGLLIAFTWFWALPFTVLPALKIWGRFVPEGFLTTCSFDYFTDDQDTKVFVACIFVWSYAIPMSLICYFYSQLFSARSLLTPIATMVPAVCCKVVSCIDPWVYAINHPRYRAELQKRVPWLGVREQDPDTVSTTTSVATAQSTAPPVEA